MIRTARRVDTDSTTRDRFQGNSVQHVNKYRSLNMYIATNIAKIKYTIHTSSFRVLYLSHIFFFILLLQLTNHTLVLHLIPICPIHLKALCPTIKAPSLISFYLYPSILSSLKTTSKNFQAMWLSNALKCDDLFGNEVMGIYVYK